MLDALVESGIQFSLWVQSWSSSLVPLWDAFSQLGTTEFYLLVMPLIYWCIDYGFGLRLGIILLLGSGLNNVFKLAWRLPRPYWAAAPIEGYWFEPSFGAPSGHAQMPLGIWGLAAAKVRRSWFTILAIVVLFGIGFSRIALGAHFYFDVLSGWLLGGLTLVLFLKYEERVASWLRSLTGARQTLFALAVSLSLIALGALPNALSPFSLPSAWQTNAIADLGEGLGEVNGLSELITPMGALFGLAVGVVWLEKRGSYQANGPLRQKAARFVIGAAVVLAIWIGLGAVFPRGQDLLSYSLRYLRYALVGAWIAGGAPLLFRRLGLAKAPGQ